MKEYSSMIKYEDIHFVDSMKAVWNYSLFTEEDIHKFPNGTQCRGGIVQNVKWISGMRLCLFLDDHHL